MRKMLILLLFSCLLIGCTDKNLIIELDNLERPMVRKTRLSLIMAGDALIHSSIYNDAKVSEEEYDFKYIFEDIKPLVQGHDLGFYNQETIIGGKKMGLSTYPRFNSPEEIGDALVDGGFNIVALANNHSLDKGIEGISNSNNYWKTKDVMVNGTANSIDEREDIDIKKKNDISYTMLSYTTGTNGLKTPSNMDYLLNVYDKEKVKEDILKVRDKVDLLIVSMHWGVEYVHEPNQEQKDIANYLATLGVDIVVGHHPHVIQPIEFIDDTLVIYSLGNFVSAQVGLERLVGVLVSVDINKEVINDKITINIENVKAQLIYTSYNNFHDYRVVPYNKLTNDILKDYKNKLNFYAEILKKYDNNIIVNEEF